MNKMILGFGASLLLTAAFSVNAMAEDAPAAAPAAPAAAAPAEQPKAEVAAPAAQTEQAAKPVVKKAKKSKKSKKVVKACPTPAEEAAASRRAELSQAMAREVEKRKGTAPYGAEARAKDLDRDIESMTKAASLVTDEAHKARLLSMLEHLKGLRARYN
jgi:outer membrane biosynthesis protein TonB